MIDQPKALSELVITKIVRILSVRRGRTHWECQNREHWALVVRESGKALFYTQAKTLASTPNTVLIIPKGTSYSFECQRQRLAGNTGVYKKLFAVTVNIG